MENWQRRLIIVSDESGRREEVVFTTDDETPAEDWCAVGQTVSFDEVIDADLPGIFPEDVSLRRQW